MIDHPKLIQDTEAGIDWLRRNDKLLAGVIDRVGPVAFNPHRKPFESLVFSIVSQMVSTKAADTVKRRLQDYTERNVTAEVLDRISQEEFRQFGIGAQKYGYIRHLTDKYLENPAFFTQLYQLPDKEVLKALVSLKGIGKWTAQMFMMFCLCRLDVFAPDDFGLRKSMEELYKWKEKPTNKQLVEKAEKWAPYRTIASMYLWRHQDT